MRRSTERPRSFVRPYGFDEDLAAAAWIAISLWSLIAFALWGLS